MIQNANKKTVSQSTPGIPYVGDAITSFFQRIVFGIIQKTQVDGFTQEIIEEVENYGVRQPFSPEQLKILKEGERSWNWSNLHCATDLILNTDDRILIHGVRYRVMSKTDYTEYGYLEYSIVEDYVNE